MPEVARTAEHARLRDITNDHSGWRRWGPYLSERSWGTVREDYSSDGNARIGCGEYSPECSTRRSF